MMDATEKWGDDVDSAVELALAELELSRDEVEIEVLEQPSRGFFGIGSRLAHVRVSRKKPEEKQQAAEEKTEEEKADNTVINENVEAGYSAPSDTAAADDEPEPDHEAAEEAAGKEENASTADRKPGDRKKSSRGNRGRADRRHGKGERRGRRSRGRSDSGAEYVSKLPELDFHREMDRLPEAEDHPAKKFLEEVIEKMGVDLTVQCKADESNVLIEISGPDTRTVIGKRGQTLDALQYLTSLVVNKNRKDYVRVVVDAENYRSRREKTLEQLADRLARKVVRTGQSVRLEPMNPYERKVIHSTLQSNPDVTTRSEGQDPYRRVIIELK